MAAQTHSHALPCALRAHRRPGTLSGASPRRRRERRGGAVPAAPPRRRALEPVRALPAPAGRRVFRGDGDAVAAAGDARRATGAVGEARLDRRPPERRAAARGEASGVLPCTAAAAAAAAASSSSSCSSFVSGDPSRTWASGSAAPRRREDDRRPWPSGGERVQRLPPPAENAAGLLGLDVRANPPVPCPASTHSAAEPAVLVAAGDGGSAGAVTHSALTCSINAPSSCSCQCASAPYISPASSASTAPRACMRGTGDSALAGAPRLSPRCSADGGAGCSGTRFPLYRADAARAWWRMRGVPRKRTMPSAQSERREGVPTRLASLPGATGAAVAVAPGVRGGATRIAGPRRARDRSAVPAERTPRASRALEPCCGRAAGETKLSRANEREPPGGGGVSASSSCSSCSAANSASASICAGPRNS